MPELLLGLLPTVPPVLNLFPDTVVTFFLPDADGVAGPFPAVAFDRAGVFFFALGGIAQFLDQYRCNSVIIDAINDRTSVALRRLLLCCESTSTMNLLRWLGLWFV